MRKLLCWFGWHKPEYVVESSHDGVEIGGFVCACNAELYWENGELKCRK